MIIMKKYIILLVTLLSCLYCFSQLTTIRGSVIDKNTGEALIGASVVYGKGKGVSADYEGNFEFSLPSGENPLKISLENAKQIIREGLEKKQKSLIHDFGEIRIIEGRFGPYIKSGKKTIRFLKE